MIIGDFSLYDDTAVDMTTAVLYTLNDQSNLRSSRFTVFGNPNDYLRKLASSIAGVRVEVLSRRLTTVYDGFHAVATDIHTTRIYYSNNALGVVAYSPIYNNDTDDQHFTAPPICKRVNFQLFR